MSKMEDNKHQRIKKDEEYILELMQDIDCLDQLKQWTEGVNIFRVLRIARTEIRHSNMLAWLLDPNENHGLGSRFLEDFIIDLSKPHYYESAKEYDPIITPTSAIDLLSSDLSDTRVFREWNHIDILLILPKGYTVAIENKVDSSESKDGDGKSQLTRYSDALRIHYDPNKCVKVFLTPYGDEPTDKNWHVYTYSDILSVLEKSLAPQEKYLSTEVTLLIKHYIEILKNDIMEDRLKNLCNEIYQKHKDAFDLIFENRENVTSMASQICFNKIKDLASSGDSNCIKELLTQKPGVNIRFTTEWSEVLKEKLKEESIEVFYQYVFKPSGNYGVNASLSLTLHNQKKEFNKEVADVINKYAMKNKIKDGKDWEWKGIWGENKSFNELSDDTIAAWIDDSLKHISKYQSKDRPHEKSL